MTFPLEATFRIVRAILFICAAIMLTSCGGVTTRENLQFQVDPGDYASIAHEALRLLERTRSIDVIAVPASMNPNARAGLKSQRKIVARESLPPHSLPRDYLAMRSFVIDEDGIAIFEGEISTDAQDALPAGSVDCGLIFSVRYQLIGNDWHSDSYKLTDCTQERVWYPKGP
jgi:hypothetical protein